MSAPEISRRRLLRLATALPFGAILAACSSPKIPDAPLINESAEEPTPTSTPEPPFIVAEGEEKRLLLEGTPHETPLYVFGSGRLGPIVAVLGGVHGNEPAGWLAAEALVDEVRPENGALLVVPRANKIATQLFERTTEDLGDLNRLYPGDRDGSLPMSRMAFEIVQTLREFHAQYLVDMHESWAFYKDRPQSGTAFLGQTVSSPSEAGLSLARSVVEAVNQRIQAPHEEFFMREWPPRGFEFATPQVAGPTPTLSPGTTGQTAVFGGSRSSLGLPNHVPGLAAILVEMGQQQSLNRRVALHVEIVRELMTKVGA
jgi:hypothetical protein